MTQSNTHLLNGFNTRVDLDALAADRIDMVARALAEDLDGIDLSHDITAQLIGATTQAEARLICRDEAVICGVDWVQEVFTQLQTEVKLDWQVKDGERVQPNQELLRIKGNARAILTGERTALNFLQTLSGVATTTAHYVSYLAGSQTKLLDTRKTIPGLRTAQKYAVVCGGGANHRVGLYDAFLIKENHIMACGGIAAAITQARQLEPGKPVEVEVENLAEYREAIAAKADIIMLDNFSIEDLKAAVLERTTDVALEVSGNITAERLTELAPIGVDYISSGALTKNLQAIDLSLRFITL